ncbi:class I SAM-dependent rRNA methyltransferase [Alkanindiges illinoisensis]|uniref:Class I SAM-dependent rRNA methyltransferase n=1 Tax=Alkanindiges illinoisensis TaxID=197183 RepID=A0A4Y7X8W0_9GAMM|nr:class I SAM-dependent rRNA methyltransferase [Alkanindiges illinoisensis]TEU23069.1 class I SAM-dependent rRNA methyltransferase [Alkanindiges illinoisensis]
MSLPRLRIKKREQQRLRDGHLWVYSNEVETQVTPLKAISGNLVHLEDYRGQFIATASFNAQSLICARIVSLDEVSVLDQAFFRQKIQAALALRDTIFQQPYYRLVFGEGDFLPGIVIDRFNEILVAQISTQAIEHAKPELVAALQEIFGQDCKILFKNDGKGRHIEQLPEYTEHVGAPFNDIELIENGVQFKAPVDGQKTGWFFDHRDGRQWLNACVKGKSVLDVFSYIGGWGIQAAKHGASTVTCVDASQKAIDQIGINAQLNGLNNVQTICADAFDYLKTQDNTTYDVIVLDPPALIQKRRDFEQGRQAYFVLNEHALKRINEGGIFISASCSLHMTSDELLKIVQQVARRQNKQVQLIHQARPAADHPRLLSMPEADYLKCFMFKVTSI